MADDTAPTEDATATAAPVQDDEQLGEAGLKALQRERDTRKALEQQIRALEPLAAKARELEESQKSEQQRLEDRAAAAERERDEVRVELTRLRMATRYGISEDDLDLLGVGTDEDIEARAKRLSERLATTPATVPARPVDTSRLKSAAVDVETPPPDNNEWFRRLASKK